MGLSGLGVLWIWAVFGQQADAQVFGPGSQVPAPTVEVPALAATLERAQKDNERQQKEIEALREEVGRLRESVSESGAEEASAPIPGGFQPSFSWYGFFDLSLSKVSPPKGSVVNAYNATDTSFTQTSINLYAAPRMTERLSALIEFRFSFMPNGQETVGPEYQRVSTEYRQPFLGLTFRHGSVSMERAHLTYAFSEWLEVIAGRFLTPIGIWNVDHGSTVIIPIRQPQFLWNEMLPLNQTGLELTGQRYIGWGLNLQYALTLSNGRGPADASFDVDENKAVGARARLSYEGGGWSLTLGGSGYYGERSDYQKTGGFSDTGEPTITKTTIDERFETVLGTDLLFEGFGLRLQGELVWLRQDAVVPPRATELELWERTNAVVSTVPYYTPSLIGWSYYLLLAYELPWPHLPGVKLRPFFLYDYYSGTDLYDINIFQSFIGGLNVGLGAYVVLKVEYTHMLLDELLGRDVDAFQAQVAVSF